LCNSSYRTSEATEIGAEENSAGQENSGYKCAKGLRAESGRRADKVESVFKLLIFYLSMTGTDFDVT